MDDSEKEDGVINWSIPCLPPEMENLILSYLEQSDLLNVRLVSRTWEEFSRNNLINSNAKWLVRITNADEFNEYLKMCRQGFKKHIYSQLEIYLPCLTEEQVKDFAVSYGSVMEQYIFLSKKQSLDINSKEDDYHYHFNHSYLMLKFDEKIRLLASFEELMKTAVHLKHLVILEPFLSCLPTSSSFLTSQEHTLQNLTTLEMDFRGCETEHLLNRNEPLLVEYFIQISTALKEIKLHLSYEFNNILKLFQVEKQIELSLNITVKRDDAVRLELFSEEQIQTFNLIEQLKVKLVELRVILPGYVPIISSTGARLMGSIANAAIHHSSTLEALSIPIECIDYDVSISFAEAVFPSLKYFGLRNTNRITSPFARSWRYDDNGMLLNLKSSQFPKLATLVMDSYYEDWDILLQHQIYETITEVNIIDSYHGIFPDQDEESTRITRIHRNLHINFPNLRHLKIGWIHQSHLAFILTNFVRLEFFQFGYDDKIPAERRNDADLISTIRLFSNMTDLKKLLVYGDIGMIWLQMLAELSQTRKLKPLKMLLLRSFLDIEAKSNSKDKVEEYKSVLQQCHEETKIHFFKDDDESSVEDSDEDEQHPRDSLIQPNGRFFSFFSNMEQLLNWNP